MTAPVLPPELVSCPDPERLAHRAAALFIAVARASVAARGRFVVALSGGSTPKAMLALLADRWYRTQVPWARTHVFWSDERCVPPDHADSNFRMARVALLDRVKIPAGQIHRIAGELAEPTEAARRCEAEVRALLGTAPRFDLVLLGLGDDGHTASLFPGTAALGETQRLVVANHVPRLDSWRVTFTAPLINQAAHVVFLVADRKKQAVLHEVRHGPREPQRLPGQLIAPHRGRLLWLVLDGMG